MFRLLAREVPAAELHEVRRFEAQWEREASVRLRDGDLAAVAAYDRHGRIRGADEEAAYDRAASMWLADHLRGKDVLLLAGSNAEAAELSRRVQARLIAARRRRAAAGGAVGRQPRRDRRPGPRPPEHRDRRRRPQTHQPRHPEDHRAGGDRTPRCGGSAWTGPGPGRSGSPGPTSPAHAELGYGGNVHVAQGRTVDTAHLLVTGSLSRQALYVGMTRGRQANTAHVVTGKTAPAGQKPYQQAAPESVLADVLQRDGGRPVGHRADPPRPGMGRGNRPPAPPVVRRRQADPLPGHRRADQGQAHRIRSLAVPAGTLPAGAAAHAAGCPAGRARHRRGHRPDHRRPDGRRPVDRQRPARPPAAPAAPGAGTRRDVGAADAGERPGAGSRAGRRAR